MTTLSLGSCNGDTYLRLFDPSTGNQLAENDDYDGSLCSQITYTFTSSCRTYTLREGCDKSSSCGGLVTYSGNTVIMKSLCPSFSVTDTNSASINYATCSFTACPGDTVVMSTFSPGSCNGDTYLRLFDPSTGNQLTENDDFNDSPCSQITYTFTSSCRTYTLREGCYKSLTCGGQVTYSGNTLPTRIPSIIPSSIPSLELTNNPSQLP